MITLNKATILQSHYATSTIMVELDSIAKLLCIVLDSMLLITQDVSKYL